MQIFSSTYFSNKQKKRQHQLKFFKYILDMGGNYITLKFLLSNKEYSFHEEFF